MSQIGRADLIICVVVRFLKAACVQKKSYSLDEMVYASYRETQTLVVCNFFKHGNNSVHVNVGIFLQSHFVMIFL